MWWPLPKPPRNPAWVVPGACISRLWVATQTTTMGSLNGRTDSWSVRGAEGGVPRGCHVTLRGRCVAEGVPGGGVDGGAGERGSGAH